MSTVNCSTRLVSRSENRIASGCFGLFIISIGAFSLLAFYQFGCLLMETLNDWSFQVAGTIAHSTPSAFMTIPIAREHFLQSYSLTPVHREVLSFIENPLMLIGCCLVVSVTGYFLWRQSRNETLLVERIQNEIGQARGNFQYAQDFKSDEIYVRPSDPHGLSPVTR